MDERGFAPGPGERLLLLHLARSAVELFVGERRKLEPPHDPAWLRIKRGVFVTLRQDGALRGCIGQPWPSEPLGHALLDCAVAAASRDPRFPAVAPEELSRIRIEISLLTVPAVAAADDVLVSKHGLIVSEHGRRGLLLPQVAVEHGWDRDTFLDHTCIKAGLPPGAWRRGAKIEVFEAEVFGE